MSDHTRCGPFLLTQRPQKRQDAHYCEWNLNMLALAAKAPRIRRHPAPLHGGVETLSTLQMHFDVQQWPPIVLFYSLREWKHWGQPEFRNRPSITINLASTGFIFVLFKQHISKLGAPLYAS